MWVKGDWTARPSGAACWAWLVLGALVSACSAADAAGGRGSGSQGSGAGAGGAAGGPVAGAAGGDGIAGGTGPAPAGSGGGPAPSTADGGPVEEECAAITQATEPEVVLQDITAADLIWVVDSSCSMADEAMRVQDNLNAFTTFVEGSDIDVRVVMITQGGFVVVPAPLGTDPARFQFVDRGVGSQDGLQVLLDTFPQYQSFLRVDAPTHFVAVTDDESALPAAWFTDQMKALLGHDFTFHAIASEDTSNPSACNNLWGSACPGAANPSCQYVDLAKQTSGVFVSICTPAGQWPDIFQNLGQAVKESVPVPLPCDYVIPAPSGGEALDPDQVNVQYTATGGVPEYFGRVDAAAGCADNRGWYYDDPGAPTRVSLCPASCEAVTQGGAISIVFGCETIVLVVE